MNQGKIYRYGSGGFSGVRWGDRKPPSNKNFRFFSAKINERISSHYLESIFERVFPNGRNPLSNF